MPSTDLQTTSISEEPLVIIDRATGEVAAVSDLDDESLARLA